MFKVGDVVKYIDLGSMYYGESVYIQKHNIALDTYEISCTKMIKTLWVARDCLEEIKSITPPPNKLFQVGDRVHINYSGVSEFGTIISVGNLPGVNWQVRKDNGTSEIIGEVHMQVLPPLPPTQSTPLVQRAGTTSNISRTWQAFNPYNIIVSGTDKPTTLSNSCTHRMKFYMGLNERYLYCEVEGCKHKEETDRRS